MNKSKLMYLVSFLLGAVAGSVAAVAVTKTKYQKMIEEEHIAAEEFVRVQLAHADIEYNDMAESLKAALRTQMYDTASPEKEVDYKKLEKPSLDEAVRRARIIEAFDAGEAMVNEPVGREVYPLADHPQDDEPMEEEEDEEEEVILPPYVREEKPSDKIEIIPSDEFFDGDGNFEKITIVYYEADETLADERDTVIPNIKDVIGLEAIKSFGKDSDDPNVVYVRNHKSSCDFEVVRNPGSYEEIILGFVEEDAKKRNRKAAAKPKAVVRPKSVKEDGEV